MFAWSRKLSWLLAVAASAQAPDSTVIRVVTRLVDVSVIAHDAKGPAADLTAEDFSVFDNGTERKIAFFSRNSVSVPGKRLTPVAPNVFTNRPDVRSDAPVRLTVFVLDGLNTTFEVQARARQQLLKYVREIGPRDRVAVYALSDRLRRLQDFTGDSNQLIAAMEHFTPNLWLAKDSPAGPGRPSMNEADQFAASTDTATEAMMQYYRMHLTTDLMKDLAQDLARVPGRKNTIWLAAGFPMEIVMKGDAPDHPTSFQDELSGGGRALARSQVALYPLDVAGLTAPTGGQNVAALAVAERTRHFSMDTLAQVTGGKALYDNNDLLSAIREAVNDAEVTYTLGFYPDTRSQDGNYHRLQIDVKRKGVELRYRPGYLAADAELPTGELDGRETIHTALLNPLDVSGLPLTVRMEAADPKKPRALRLTIAIPSKDLDLRPSEVGAIATLDVIVAQRASDGRDLATFGDLVRINSDRQRGETLLREGLLIRREVPLQAGVSRVRVVVFDRGSGRIGSLEFAAAK